jgi:hypothetical protein
VVGVREGGAEVPAAKRTNRLERDAASNGMAGTAGFAAMVPPRDAGVGSARVAAAVNAAHQ